MNIRNAIRRYLDSRRAYARVFDELSNSTDRELWDLGISRADIHNIAVRAAHDAR